MGSAKQSIDDLALFGGAPLFQTVRPISNLVTPDLDIFLEFYHRSYGGEDLICLLQEELCKNHGAKYCVTFCNGLWGMVYCLTSLVQGHEVIMPSLTYRRLGDIAAWLDLVPHYCEVDPCTLTPTRETIESCINDQTGLILVTQSLTQVIDYDSIEQLAAEKGIPLVIDSVEAGYGTYRGRKIGSFGKAECFSTHASKLLNGFEGGYITTNDPILALTLEHHSRQDKMGLSPVHAAMVLASLVDLPDQIKRNKDRWDRYNSLLQRVKGLRLLTYNTVETRSYKNIVVEIENTWPFTRDQTLEILHTENMLARAYYSPPLHMKETSYPIVYGDLSITERLSQSYLLLPCGDFVSLSDIERICEFLDFLCLHEKEIKCHLGLR